MRHETGTARPPAPTANNKNEEKLTHVDEPQTDFVVLIIVEWGENTQGEIVWWFSGGRM